MIVFKTQNVNNHSQGIHLKDENWYFVMLYTLSVKITVNVNIVSLVTGNGSRILNVKLTSTGYFMSCLAVRVNRRFLYALPILVHTIRTLWETLSGSNSTVRCPCKAQRQEMTTQFLVAPVSASSPRVPFHLPRFCLPSLYFWIQQAFPVQCKGIFNTVFKLQA